VLRSARRCLSRAKADPRAPRSGLAGSARRRAPQSGRDLSGLVPELEIHACLPAARALKAAACSRAPLRSHARGASRWRAARWRHSQGIGTRPVRRSTSHSRPRGRLPRRTNSDGDAQGWRSGRRQHRGRSGRRSPAEDNRRAGRRRELVPLLPRGLGSQRWVCRVYLPVSGLARFAPFSAPAGSFPGTRGRPRLRIERFGAPL
jgi:hypothetical protein